MLDKLRAAFLGQRSPSEAKAPVEAATSTVDPELPKRRVSLEQISRSPTHPVLSGSELLELLPRWPEIENRIFRASKLTSKDFQVLYLHSIEAFAERVQFLPASQANHHAGPLGQLEHTLEVIEYALALRSAKRLPLGAEPERVSVEAPIWTYAVFAGALGHDAGRPIVRFSVRAKIKGLWHKVSMWGESLHSLGATEYAFSWVEGGDYGFHNRVAPLMLGRLLPAAGCAWLNQCPQALSELSAWLYGDQYNCGVIGEICRDADGQSAARNVGGALPGATVSESGIKMPVYKRAEQILRELAREWVVNGRAPRGATQAGGSDAWAVGSYIFVRSTVMNDLHAAMVEQGVKGLPESPPGIVTKLADAGTALSYDDPANPDRRKSVYSIRIQTADGHTVAEKFTVLVFPIDRVFPLKNRPAEFEGSITVISPKLPSEHVLAQHTRKPISPAHVDVTNRPTPTPEPVSVPSPAAQPEPPGAPAAPMAAPTVPDDGVDRSPDEQQALAFLKQAAGMTADDPDDDEVEAAAQPAVGATSATESPAVTQQAQTDSEVGHADTTMENAPVEEKKTTVGATDITAAVGTPGDAETDAPTELDTGDTWKPLNTHGDYLQSAHADVDPPIVRAFFQWLHECMSRTPGEGTITPDDKVVEMNSRNALVHGVPDLPGCLGLVTPKAFRMFLETQPYQWGADEFTTADGCDGEGSFAEELQLQNALRGSCWAVHNGMTPGQNVFTYRVDAGQDKVPAALNLVVVSAKAAGLILPVGMRAEANPVLKRSTPEDIAAAKVARKKAAGQLQPRPVPGSMEGSAQRTDRNDRRTRVNKQRKKEPKKGGESVEDLLGI